MKGLPHMILCLLFACGAPQPEVHLTGPAGKEPSHRREPLNSWIAPSQCPAAWELRVIL